MVLNIVIVDDHPVVLNGLKAFLEAEDDFSVNGYAASGSEGIALIGKLKPDIAIVDLNLPDASGLEVLEEAGRVSPRTSVIILSMHMNDFYIKAAYRKGAKAYISKHALEAEIVSAVRNAVKVSPAAGPSRLVGPDAVSRPPALPDGAPEGELSRREYQVLYRIACGSHNRDVALELAISVRTVEKHRASLMRKLGLRNHAELVHYALHNNIIKIP